MFIEYHHYNRVFKEALRSGGGQLTQRHVEDVSMAVLILLKASKKADEAFGLTPQSTTHTVVDSQKDVERMSKHLIESSVTVADHERRALPFTDPAIPGWKKFTTTKWIQDTLNKSQIQEDDEDDLQDEGEVDLYYELCDVV